MFERALNDNNNEVFLQALISGNTIFNAEQFFKLLHKHFERLYNLLDSADPLYLPFLCHLLATYSSLFLATDQDAETLLTLHGCVSHSLAHHLLSCAVLPLTFLSLHLKLLMGSLDDAT